MANREFNQFRYSLEKGSVDLYCVVNVGAAGAVTLQQWKPSTRTYAASATGGFRGIKSVVRNSAGNWTITLQDSYQRLMFAEAVSSSSTGISAAPAFGVLSTGDVTSNSTPTVNVVFANTSGTATDPGNGEQLLVHLVLQNSGAL